MIAYCPNCKGKLKPSGGVRLCTQCKGKYYILETHDPLVTISEKTGTEVNIKAVESLLLTYSAEGDLEFWREHIGYSLSDIKE